MGRPVTLFTGQWADLPLETLCKKAREFGYDGLELACWGDHFEIDKALSDDIDNYLRNDRRSSILFSATLTRCRTGVPNMNCRKRNHMS